MHLPKARSRSLGLLACAAVSVSAEEAMAQGPAPEAGQITYTPMRRSGSEAPPSSHPAYAPPTVPAYAPVPGARSGQAHALPPGVPYEPAPLKPYASPPAQRYAPSASPRYAPPRVPPATSATSSRFATSGTPAVVTNAAPTQAEIGRRTLGLGFDLGMPDGVNLGLVLSPADWLRLAGSFGTNTTSLAYRGGLSLLPVGWGPSFTFEAGHCNLAPTNSVIRTFFGVPAWVAPYVQELGYTYFNAHVGFDLVRGNVTLYLHGGYTFLMGTVRAPKSVVVDSSTGTTVTIAEDGKVYAQTLSAKLGLVFLFGGS